MDIQQLGHHVSGHAIDNARRRRTSTVILGVGVVALVLGVPLLIADINRPRGTTSEEAGQQFIQQLLGGLVGIGLLALVAGALLLAKALRAKSERYDVFERGVVHRVDDAVSVIAWSDIVSVRVQGAVSDAFLARALGTDFSCRLRLADGRRLRFNSFATGASTLAAAIDAAVNHGTPPSPPEPEPEPEPEAQA